MRPPQDFIDKWKSSRLKERAGAQEHFIDLCRLLDEETPAEADPEGSWYAFEKGALKTGGGDGWADVWKRGCFAWEYKGKGKSLDAAFAQLQRYAIALENPPLLIVSDMETIRIHTNWTNTIQKVYDIPLEDLADDQRRRVLKWAFSETEVEQLKPDKTRQELTGPEDDGVLLLLDEADKPSAIAGLGLICKLLTEELSKNSVDRLCIGLAGLPGLVQTLRESHESSPRIFHVLHLKPLEPAERLEVVDRGLTEASEKNPVQVTMTEEAKVMITTLSEGYPHFLQEFSYCAFE